jgi:hypothetical protein
MHGFPAGHLMCYFLLFARYVGFATMTFFAFLGLGKVIPWIDSKVYGFYKRKGWLK